MIEKKEGYRVRLSNFEGPLDLLLYLIKREEVDIYDIPIAEITKQYLEMIEVMRELDLEVAGEFILMAATLIQIKVRMLLPEPEDGSEDEEEDPRAELVRRLVEYKCFKEVAESMESFEVHQRRLFSRAYFEWEKQYKKTEVVLREVSMVDLMRAFKTAMENIPSVTAHEVSAIGPTIEGQIEFLMRRLTEKELTRFGELFEELKDKITIIVTFMAILELIRTHRILIQQSSIFGEIYLSAREV